MYEQKFLPILSKRALKYLNKLDIRTRERIKTGILEIPLGDIKPYKNFYRLRVGSYRIIFNWLSDNQLKILDIDIRGQVYKGGS